MEEGILTAASESHRSEADEQRLSLTVVVPVDNEGASVGGVLDDLGSGQCSSVSSDRTRSTDRLCTGRSVRSV